MKEAMLYAVTAIMSGMLTMIALLMAVKLAIMR